MAKTSPNRNFQAVMFVITQDQTIQEFCFWIQIGSCAWGKGLKIVFWDFVRMRFGKRLHPPYFCAPFHELKYNILTDCLVFISPQSERIELGAFYFCPGVLSGYCCACVWGVTVVCETEVTVIEYGGLPKCPKFTCSGDTFWQLLVTDDFDGVSLQKYGQLII